MDASRRWGRIFGVGLALTTLGTACASACSTSCHRLAVAATARTSPLAVSRIATSALDKRIESYYARALLSRSAAAVRLPGMGRFLVADANGLLETNAVVAYLEWRRSLNPIRFSQFHPNIARVLDRDRAVRTLPLIPTTPILPPIVINQTPCTCPSTQVPVPEPSTLIIGMLLASSGVILHRRRLARR
jgi:hypothetical protein